MSESEEQRPCKIRRLESDGKQEATEEREPVTTATEPVDGTLGLTDRSKDTTGLDEKPPPISKNQLKKLRRREKWEANKELRSVKRREKHKEKQARKAEERAMLEAKILSGEMPAPMVDEDQEDKAPRAPRPTQVPIGLILDTDFNDLMTEKEIISLGAQLTRCYSLNKGAQYRTHLAISSWGGVLKTRFANVLANTHLSWMGVSFFEDDDFVAVGDFLHQRMAAPGGGQQQVGALEAPNVAEDPPSQQPLPLQQLDGDESRRRDAPDAITSLPEGDATAAAASSPHHSSMVPPLAQVTCSEPSSLCSTSLMSPSLVYLTSDSPHTLTRLEPHTSYIIGGIVDKNRHKGICYKRACARGIPTAKLPIGKYMKMQSRTVLAVNHVVEIMLKWLETGDWGEAFLRVIPKRKQAQLKTREEDDTSQCDS